MDAQTPGGLSLEGIDADETIIQGRVTRGGDAVPAAIVHLLDAAEELTAEVPTSVSGYFRFFCAPGEWTLRTHSPPSQPVDVPATARLGEVTEVSVELPAHLT